ncbi:unnamed protein product [Mytilus edulis]|uniref:Uncharacterized protein n=1 Tax=Mytilus edulis TaxID=6550 RepID=A0A8S3TG40_MYTED|nr:unnamed protein product [Mytilus edulis]
MNKCQDTKTSPALPRNSPVITAHLTLTTINLTVPPQKNKYDFIYKYLTITITRRKTEKSTDDLFQILITIKDNQESMRKSLEQRMTNLEKTFTREIKENMDKLKSEMTLEFAQVDNKIKELETKMKDVEFKLTQNVNIENSGNSVHPKLVFKNVQPIDNESEESLKVYANGLLRALELDFDVLKVERITAHLNRTATSPNQRPKPLIVS